MKCSVCGADGTVTVHPRKKRAGETRVFRCSADRTHSRILKKGELVDAKGSDIGAGPRGQTLTVGSKANIQVQFYNKDDGVPAKPAETQPAPAPEPKKNPKRSVVGHFLAKHFGGADE